MRKTLLVMLAATAMLAVSLPVDAGGGYRGHGYYGGYRGGARVGVYIGAPLAVGAWWGGWPRSYYAPYYAYPYYPPTVVRERVIVQEPLVFYDENGNPVPSEQSQAQSRPQERASAPPQAAAATPVWYFCADTQTYYPYAKECASPWQRVIPHPPPQ